MWRRAASRHLGAGTAAAGLAAFLLSAPASIEGQERTGGTAPVADVSERTILDLQADMTAGRLTARQIAAAHLARIEAYDADGPALNAMIALNPRALDEARALDEERQARGPRGPLHGIPVVIKDNYETADMPTTGGSVALAGFRTGRDAFQVVKLREAGAVVLGKTNLHELAAGIITISSLGGQTKNPYDLTRTPGGSSGGTAAAVAAGFAVGGMASDTCGSIRIPAANNNLWGLRGTAGLSSRTGIIPLSHTQDIGGPLARTVTDLAILLDATVGEDPSDPATAEGRAHQPVRFQEALASASLKGVRIGILEPLFGAAPEDDEVSRLVREALKAMEAQGAVLVDVRVPGLEAMLEDSSLIALEFKTDLIEYLGQFPDAPVASLQDILDRGAYHAALEATFKLRNAAEVTPDGLRRVQARRAAVTALMRTVFEEHDVAALAYPTLKRRPVVVDEPQRGTNCQLSATTGFPAMAMPAGFTADGVPIGFELLGPAWSDARLVALARAYEQAATPRRPAPSTPPLVDGAAPGPVVLRLAAVDGVAPAGARLQFHPVSGRLVYELPAGTMAASLHRAAPGIDGPVIHRLVNPAAVQTSGSVVLPPYQRPWLHEGRLVLSVQNVSGRTVFALEVPAR